MRNLIFLCIAITCACAHDPIQDACQRADECNALTGSVQECTEDFDSGLNKLPQSDQDEYRQEVTDCLDHASCSAFVTCINDVLGG